MKAVLDLRWRGLGFVNGSEDSPSRAWFDTMVALLNPGNMEQVFEQILVMEVQSCELHSQSAEVDIRLSCILVGH